MDVLKGLGILLLVTFARGQLFPRLGMEDGRLTDAQITASSCWAANHCTDRARLNQPQGGGYTGAWSAKTNDQNQFIQVDLRTLHLVGGVQTQGRNGYDQWVTSFAVQYSLDGLTWTSALNGIQITSQTFTGNSNRDTVVTNDFAEPVIARFVRFLPMTWSGHISMRFEVLGEPYSKVEGPEKALGMADGEIPDSAITASSEFNANHGPARARVDTVAGGGKTGAWSARVNNVNQWIQVDLNRFYLVTGIISQGRQDYDQWVRTYTVSYSEDGNTFTPILDCNGDAKTFTANTDRNTKVTNRFARSVLARFIRILPATWNNHISMRFELLGKGPVGGQRFEPIKLGMESGRITDAMLSSSTCFNANHCVNRARLNQVAGGGQTGAWSAQINDHVQWIQVDLGTDYELHGVITQGRSDLDQWVMSYKLQYRPDGGTTLLDVIGDNTQPRIFPGNTDRNSLVVNTLSMPVTARYVRILPFTWYGHISMRFELLGDGPINVVPVAAKLGIEDGRIALTSLSASSSYGRSNHDVAGSRLNQPQISGRVGSWSARVNNADQWIQVDLCSAFEVTGVITQGRHESSTNFNQWVTSYKISYSIDGKDWTFVTDCNEDQVFQGNYDRNSPVQNSISPPVTARFFRLHPQSWHNHISMRWELVGEGPFTLVEASKKLGVEDYRIPDTAMSASTVFDGNHNAARGRLNLPLQGARKGGWSAQINDHSQYLQVNLRGLYRVTGVITQGRADANQWVTSFKVEHSLNGQDWTVVKDNGLPPQDKVFDGNSDRTTEVTNLFSPPLTTRFVRFRPHEWLGHISMRVELLGAGPVADILKDIVPLGLESNVVSDSQLSASSEYDADHGPKRCRLNLARVGNLRGAWSARHNNVNQWIQVDFLTPYRVVAVATQGRQDVSQWVRTYKVACSLDGTTFDVVQGICTNPGADRIFTGNSDRNTIVTNQLPVPVICQYVRILPLTWNGHISMRMELYGEGPVHE
ncbi:uncharacterized protein [Diadema setosum]|uniref:uncharacterized protein n=1 Tax=Diadema setosum TaxID=31175 RepID=UPI003B3A850F